MPHFQGLTVAGMESDIHAAHGWLQAEAWALTLAAAAIPAGFP